MAELKWLRFGLMVCLISIVVQSMKTSALQQYWFPDHNRIEFEEKRSLQNENEKLPQTLGCCATETRILRDKSYITTTGDWFRFMPNQCIVEVICLDSVINKVCGKNLETNRIHVCTQKFRYIEVFVSDEIFPKDESKSTYKREKMIVRNGCQCIES